jgi:hypothetical protein
MAAAARGGEQPVGALRLLGARLERAAHQEMARRVVAMLLGVDDQHSGFLDGASSSIGWHVTVRLL